MNSIHPITLPRIFAYKLGWNACWRNHWRIMVIWNLSICARKWVNRWHCKRKLERNGCWKRNIRRKRLQCKAIWDVAEDHVQVREEAILQAEGDFGEEEIRVFGEIGRRSWCEDLLPLGCCRSYSSSVDASKRAKRLAEGKGIRCWFSVYRLLYCFLIPNKQTQRCLKRLKTGITSHPQIQTALKRPSDPVVAFLLKDASSPRHQSCT